MKQIYARDSVIRVKGGAVVARLARRVRPGEELPVTRALAEGRVPDTRNPARRSRIRRRGFAILDEKTAVCSLSVACNAEGVRQMNNVLGTMGIELIPVHNPGYHIHIDGAFVMVDVDTAIVNMNELPYVFIDYLKSRKMKLISVPPEDNAFSVNCLAVGPRRVIMHTSVSPRLADKLDKSGIKVLPVGYDCVELGGAGSTARRLRSRAIRSDFASGF